MVKREPVKSENPTPDDVHKIASHIEKNCPDLWDEWGRLEKEDETLASIKQKILQVLRDVVPHLAYHEATSAVHEVRKVVRSRFGLPI